VCGILSDASRTAVQRAIEDHAILVNGTPIAKNYKIRPGDAITGSLSEACNPDTLEPENIPVQVLYEDTHLVVINKPAGMVVHPGAGVKSGTLANALLYRWREEIAGVGDVSRPGMVHRLDKETSGILLIAKNNRTHRALQSQFESRSLSKTYIAIVKGRVEFEQGHIDKPIGHHPKIRERRAVSNAETARDAQTHYRVLRRFHYATLLEVKILTGRTHQIRVHMEHLGYPVIGDELYGTRLKSERLALHAAKIEFAHPTTGDIMCFKSEWPADFKAMIEKAEKAERA